jgi:hypothetical protein
MTAPQKASYTAALVSLNVYLAVHCPYRLLWAYFFPGKKKSPFFSSLLVFHVDMQSPETVNKRAAI